MKPRVDLSQYGPLLVGREYRAVIRVSERTFRRQLKSGTLDVPPAMTRPYRWRKADLQQHLDTIDLPTDRKRKAKWGRDAAHAA